MINPISFILSPFKLYAAAGTIIALSVVVGVHLYNDRGVRIERDTAIADLASYKTKIEAATAKRELENAAAKKASEQSLADSQVTIHNLIIANNLTNINRNELEKKVSAANDRYLQAQAITDHTRATSADALRLATSREGIRVSEKPDATRGLSTCDSDYASLREACKVTTIDLIECQIGRAHV